MTPSLRTTVFALLTLSATACDGGAVLMDTGPPPPFGDGGTMTDDDGGMPPPSPSTDSCSASTMDANATTGCNGGVYGPTAQANAIGGACTPDGAEGPGGCAAAAGTEAVCVPDAEGASTGTCAYFCPPAMDYVTTGGCPTGARCFTLEDFSACFRDCRSAADCFPGEQCDSEGSCVASGEPGDAGTPLPDAGTPDAGTPDAGPPGCACDTGAGCQFGCDCDPDCSVNLGARCNECDAIHGSVGNCFQTGDAVVSTCGGVSSGSPSDIPYCRRGPSDARGYCTVSCSGSCPTGYTCQDTGAGIMGCLQ